MRLFLAGAESTMEIRRVLRQVKAPNMLLSYFYMGKVGTLDEFMAFFQHTPFLFIDSGGFTARMHNKTIDIAKYVEFLQKYSKKYEMVYANFDVMDTAGTLRNQAFLESQGLHPIPVYHFDEYAKGNKELLDQYIKDHDYIALGGAAGVFNTRKNLETFFSYVFSKTTDKIKVHGFGITGIDFLARFPFYSADSTSWVTAVKYGAGRIPKRKGVASTSIFRYRTKHDNTEDLIALSKLVNDVVDVYSTDIGLQRRKRLELSAHAYMKMEKYFTQLWEKRGVVWKT